MGKLKNRCYPGFGGLLLMDHTYVDELVDKVSDHCINEKRYSGKMVKRKYKKQRNSNHPNMGKLLHMKPVYVEHYNNNVGAYCVASCGEWYVILDPARNCGCFLWNCVSQQKIQFPKLTINQKNCFKCILTSPPTKKHCQVMFFHKNRPVIYCCALGYKWTQWTYYTIGDRVFSDAISCNGNIYAITGDGKLLYEITSRPGYLDVFIASKETEEVVTPEKQYLVLSRSEVYLVQIFSLHNLEVYKMDFSGGEWERSKSVGDRAFFVSCSNSVSLEAKELGVEGNCVYFTEDSSQESLYVYSIQDGSLSACHRRPNSTVLALSTEAQMPVSRFSDNPRNQQLKELEDKEVAEVDPENMSLFQQLPLGLVERIARSGTIGRDYMNFRLVCRRWSLAARPCRWLHNSESPVLPYPWLMFFNGQKKETCSFYDPGGEVTYQKQNTGISAADCVIRFSKEGWLLLSQGKDHLFLIQLVTRSRIKLPDISLPEIRGMCFSGLPGSSDFVVVAVAQAEIGKSCIAYLLPNRNNWIYVYKEFLPSWNSMVFMNNRCFILGQDGSLGVLKVIEPPRSWAVLKPTGQLKLFPARTCRSFLVSLNQYSLLSVFLGNSDKEVDLYKFNMYGRKWEKLDSLDGCTLFVSGTACLVVTKEKQSLVEMRNKIYFPLFRRSNNGIELLPYSLETRKFGGNEENHCFEGNFCDSKELLHCTWIRLRLRPTF